MSGAFLRLFPVSIATAGWGESFSSGSDEAEESKNHLPYAISDIYRRHVTDIKKISPYDAGPFPNYPAGTNILYLPFDTYYTVKALYEAGKRRDYEGMQDASARLLGAPANCISALGTILEWGLGLHILPSSLISLLPFTYVFGVALCVIEGTVDIFSLFRQHDFRSEFDFSAISGLKTLIENPEDLGNYETVKELIKNADLEHIRELFPGQADQVIKSFQTLKKEMEEHSFYRRHVVQSHAPKIKAVAERVLLSNLITLQQNYLQLNPEEVKEICEKISSKHGDKPMDEQLDKLESKLKKALEVKKMCLARRIRPWMVEEASLKTQDIIEGLISDSPEAREKALNEGLSLMNDINIQSKKKQIIHIIGVIALVIAAASIITMAVGCPVLIPYILIGIATTIALVRFIAYKGVLDVRGWQFSPKHLLPDFIRKNMFPDEEEERRKKLKEKEISQLNQPYHHIPFTYGFDPRLEVAFNCAHAPSLLRGKQFA